MLGESRSSILGNVFTVAGLLAGSVGLFAGGALAVIATLAAVVCVGGLCATVVAQEREREAIREWSSRGWEPQPMAEAESPAIGPEVGPSLPEKSWVASLDSTRSVGRAR